MQCRFNKLPDPPKLPDKESMEIDQTTHASFKEALISPITLTSKLEEITALQMSCRTQVYEEDQEGLQQTGESNRTGLDRITLSNDDKNRIYQSWGFSIIIKLLGKRLAHQYLRNRLKSLWKSSEEIILIDLGHDYYIVKFLKEENMILALQGGPWFINGYYLSIKRWQPTFVASEAKETYSSIWIRLSELPTEYYDHTILAKIGNKLGKLVKTDVCTSVTLRGRYAKICIEVPVKHPVRSHIQIGNLKQKIIYEGDGILCLSCGRVGHTTIACSYTKQSKETSDANRKELPGDTRAAETDEK
ncbi:hypothetical protein KY290_024643 [Solanum tuberosum]|uniref:DUF4283 domain-containing protein n=1 Tax=Solanum tuberosum TaxID=4113 RepID=A0ABQ7UTA4_SOLTU|nr:hypothetical protein KY284_023491 [Solanum tuberosum]KAH0754373.1 hypothetical protein KY290_024643 [Solanum tuberosum]